MKYFPLNVQKTFVTDIWEKNKNLILKWPEATQNKSHQKPKWIKNVIIYLQQKNIDDKLKLGLDGNKIRVKHQHF